MKHQKLHITIITLWIWRFFSDSHILVNKPERIAKKKCLLVILLFTFAISFSQQFTNYTTKDGLPSNLVYKIGQDQKGFLWFATDKGLVKYNGNTMKTFTTKNGLATNDVWGIFPTPDGKLWYLSKTSKLGYIKNDSVYAFESEIKGEIFSPLLTSQVGNDLILASSNRFHVLKNKKWRVLNGWHPKDSLAYNYIKHPTVLNYKTSSLLDSVVIQDKTNKTVKTFGFGDVLKKNHIRGQITDSLFYWVNDKQYNILNLNTLKLHKKYFKDEIGIEQSKYVRLNLVNNQIQISGKGFVGVLDKDLHITNTYYIPEYLNAHFGFFDSLGSVWVSTFTDGIYHLPKEKQNIKYCLPTETVTNIGSVNNKIIANVFNKGFYKYDDAKKKFVLFIEEEEYLFDASYIKELNTEFYLSKLNSRTVKNGKIEEIGLLSDSNDIHYKTRQLVVANNSLYGEYSFGVNKINPNNFEIEKEYHQLGINQLLPFNDRFLVATFSGLKEFKDEKFKPIAFTNQEFNKSILNLKKVSEKELLINTDGFGAYITDLKTIKQLPGSEFLIVNNAFVENNNIWLATESGILKYTKVKEVYTVQMQIDKSNGLPSNHVNDVFVYQDNLMVGTNNGIAIFPKEVKSKSQLLDVYIDKAQYDNQDISINNAVFKYQKNNNLNFTISNIDFSDKNVGFSYAYKLEPIHKDWSTTTTNKFSFNNLEPGEYTLHIAANSLKKELSFTIKPLWWQTVSFKVFIVLFGVFLVALISRFFVKRSQFKKNQKIFEDKRLSELQLKALRSQMNPHFVFNSLSAIQYYIGENDFEASELYLVKFSKLIRQFFELSKENEITLATEVSLLHNYLEIEKLRFKEKLNFSIHVDPSLNTKRTRIPTMLLQPIVENAVNHGVFNKLENGLVTLNFLHVDAQTFKVEIIDDGVGFANTKKRQSKKVKSSNVLKDRLHFLNYSEKWEITYKEEEVHPDRADRGNKSVFLIKTNN
ncbi:histidine kinase [Lacinutrix sp. MEBiC02404]